MRPKANILLNNSGINLRPFQDGQESDLGSLIANNFPNTRSAKQLAEVWRWQFKSSICIHTNVMVAEHLGKLVAQYAVMGFKMNYFGQSILAGISSATVTDRGYRGKFLFVRLALKLYEDMQGKDYKVIYGFPNAQSIKGFIKHLGWQEVGALPVLLRPLDIKPILQKCFGQTLVSKCIGKTTNILLRYIFGQERAVDSKGLCIRASDNFPPEIEDLWKQTHISEKIALIRDRAYLKWRYCEKPYSYYNIQLLYKRGILKGYCVTSLSEKMGLLILYIMELVVVDDDRYFTRILLDHIVYFLRKAFFPVPRILFPQDIYFCARRNSADINTKALFDRSNWYISWGDSDVV